MNTRIKPIIIDVSLKASEQAGFIYDYLAEEKPNYKEAKAQCYRVQWLLESCIKLIEFAQVEPKEYK